MLLLVVLSLLILFSLVAITFVLVAGSYYDATRNAVRNEQVGDDPRQLLDEVLGQCIRGTTNPHSVIRGHSLLEDLYGNDGITYSELGFTPPVTPTIAVASVAGNGQVFDLTFTPAVAPTPVPLPLPPPPRVPVPPSPPTNTINHTAFPRFPVYASMDVDYPMSVLMTAPRIQTPGFFNGCVFTAIGGAADRKSSRVLGWGFSGGQYRIRLMAFDGLPFTDLNASKPTGFIINGRPFNGTGFGLNTHATSVNPMTDETLLSAVEDIPTASGTPHKVPFALLPNPIFADPTKLDPTLIDPATVVYPQFGGLGGADEDYDAPDAQNMLLGYVPITIASGAIIPSLHRPETILKVGQDAAAAGVAPADLRVLQRQLILRPYTFGTPNFSAHPEFPDLNPAVGYDVDNDGDGIAESIWVDAGLPVRTAADGRTYKPLVAILCLDMDGRLNVNAHGNIAHVDNYYQGATPPAFAATGIVNTQFNVTAPFKELMRGQGYGPAEISLYPLFPIPPAPLALPTSLTAPATPSEHYTKLLAGRYSEPNMNLFDRVRDPTGYDPVYDSSAGFVAPPGQKLGAYPGATQLLEPLSGLKFTHYPVPNVAPDVPTSFGSPPDLQGKGFVALDARGMPIHVYMNELEDRIDSPYELNLNRGRVRDSASPTSTVVAVAIPSDTPNPLDSTYSTAELESVLRMYDLDASQLPDRLRAILEAGGGPAVGLLRQAITTDSFDLPTPPVLPTRDMRRAAGATPIVSPSIGDLLKIRLTAGLFGGNFNDEIKKMLPQELVAGKRMDINRPFGNGRDDDNDGIVDEPGEVETAIWSSTTMAVPTQHTSTAVWPNLTNGIDMDGDNDVDDDDNRFARQLYARHLYILMMMLKDETYPFDADNDGATSDVETATAIAQWAINVVDYRDRDSIMTPFEFNVYPFRDGWTADGDLSVTDPAKESVVWGCERPELLITETLAFHDRRTEDLSVDDTHFMPMAVADTDFDQRVPPRGSLFIELYNPWVTQTSSSNATGLPGLLEAPGEFYNVDPVAGTVNGLDLRAAEPTGSPVWRMLIVAGSETDTVSGVQYPKDPDHPDPLRRPAPANVERSIYFTPPPVAIADDGQKYYAGTAQTLAPLLPGRYAVIGSAGVPVGGKYITTIGRRNLSHLPGTADTAQDGATHAQLNTTRRIELTPSEDLTVPQALIYENSVADPAASNYLPPMAVVIDKALDGGAEVSRSVSVSEPVTGYTNVGAGPNEPLMASVEDEPIDNSLVRNPAAPTNSSLFRILYLQRLADPTQPYHATANPYRTIDSAPIALSVFNGLNVEPTIAHTGLASWQRGGLNGGGDGTSSMIWTYGPPTGSTASAEDDASHNFNRILEHSLGYLNTGYGPVGVAASAFITGNTPFNSYLGSPNAKPFPLLSWNNRPYVGSMEMMLVPKSRSSRLMFEYTPPNDQPYNAPPIPPTSPGHVLPFFQTAPSGGPLPNFQRVFDYLGVPSRFVGTETELNPQTMGALPTYDTTLAEQGMMSYLHPPFNQVSNYREPGKVNINTIPSDFNTDNSSLVWNGILNRPATDPTPLTWTNVAQSRQGALTPDSVSRFISPFRSSAGESLILPGDAHIVNREEVDVTMLRPLAPDSNTPTDVPLFNYYSTAAYNDTTKHPYFGNQTLQRLNNVLTTRSNVYAIWITVGYFEVGAGLPTAPGTRQLEWYPDGYHLKAEMGSDTGEIERHRAFYIYDRSIPVGFEPGKDHNYADGLLLKRFIE